MSAPGVRRRPSPVSLRRMCPVRSDPRSARADAAEWDPSLGRSADLLPHCHISSGLASLVACLSRGYRRAGTQNDRLGKSFFPTVRGTVPIARPCACTYLAMSLRPTAAATEPPLDSRALSTLSRWLDDERQRSISSDRAGDAGRDDPPAAAVPPWSLEIDPAAAPQRDTARHGDCGVFLCAAADWWVASVVASDLPSNPPSDLPSKPSSNLPSNLPSNPPSNPPSIPPLVAASSLTDPPLAGGGGGPRSRYGRYGSDDMPAFRRRLGHVLLKSRAARKEATAQPDAAGREGSTGNARAALSGRGDPLADESSGDPPCWGLPAASKCSS